MKTTAFITREELLIHWQGHRDLTRRTIEKFPEEELFHYSIGGMRPFADLIKELLTIAVPGLQEIIHKDQGSLSHDILVTSKAELLKLWDEQTPQVTSLFEQIKDEEFHEEVNLFGEYKNKIYASILYFYDNEIHHRAQGYVYLRALGIEPPFFWDRP
ncbi:DinB family protein [Sphingobacterium sp. HJSM2_6]|uniref:DinB family protein n=1 Tax=Sphingobacterium sp. HJSM2_6 TaxID=3366264 RepID=UPI003BC8A935